MNDKEIGIRPHICFLEFRGKFCGYTGPVKTEGDVCGKTLDDCKLHWGINVPLPFAGYPEQLSSREDIK